MLVWVAKIKLLGIAAAGFYMGWNRWMPFLQQQHQALKEHRRLYCCCSILTHFVCSG